MGWLSLIGGLVGVVGLLYGLLERSKRQAAVSKADTISKERSALAVEYDAFKERFWREAVEYSRVIARLQHELVARVPKEDLADLWNSLYGGVPEGGELSPTAPAGVPKDPSAKAGTNDGS